ncbi:GAF domain-containing protein, partial [bacterium]
VASALGDVSHPQQLLALVLEKSREVTGAARGTLYIVDERTGALVTVRSTGQSKRAVAPLSVAIGQGVAGRVAKSGKPMIVSDTSRHLRFLSAVDKQLGVRTRNMLCVPIRDNAGRVHGVIQVINRARGAFTKADVATLQALATQAAVSIVQVNLVTTLRYESAELSATKEELERRVRDLHLLFDLERAMARVESLEELLLSALREAKRVTLASRAMFLIRDPETDVLSLFTQGPRGATLERHPVKGPLGLIGHAMRHDETTRTDDAASDPRAATGEVREILRENGSGLCVPLEGDDGRSLGAIGLYGKMIGFDEEDEAIVLLVCANVATALRLHWSREAREREERLTTIGRLLSGVIHDLKTPLSVISGYVQLMQAADSRPKRDEYAQLMV